MHSLEQIIDKLRKAEALITQVMKVPEFCKEICVSEQSYCRWRSKYADAHGT